MNAKTQVKNECVFNPSDPFGLGCFDLRDSDVFGSGAFEAPRGSHKHRGIDVACKQNEVICACAAGTVTKLGFPYNPSNPKKGHLRYVQVTDADDNDVRYFYVRPLVKCGDKLEVGSAVGMVQGLVQIYPGITEHFHFEVKRNGEVINPHDYLTIQEDAA